MLAASVVGSMAGREMGCNTALARCALVAQGKDLAPQAPTGETSVVVWPSGHSVREDSGRLARADRFGRVKAREGDRIGVAGVSASTTSSMAAETSRSKRRSRHGLTGMMSTLRT
jgi:hypothetical protein